LYTENGKITTTTTTTLLIPNHTCFSLLSLLSSALLGCPSAPVASASFPGLFSPLAWGVPPLI